jgi:hypothetical protein
VPTVADAITDALGELGVIGESDTPSAGDMAKGYSTLNSLTDAWGAERLTIPYIARTVATLTASTSSFTVGTGGNINIVRPAFITKISYQDTSQSPTLELPLYNLTDDEYATIPQKGLTSTIPTSAYYNPTYASGFGTLVPWPIPTSATLQWVIYSPVAVPNFSATSASIVLPPGYYEFIVSNLAYKLCSVYGVPAEVRQNLKEEARDSKMTIKAANYRPSDLAMPAGAVFGNSRHISYTAFVSGQ